MFPGVAEYGLSDCVWIAAVLILRNPMKSICVEYTVHEDFNRWYQCIDASLEATTNSKMRSYTMPELVAME